MRRSKRSGKNPTNAGSNGVEPADPSDNTAHADAASDDAVGYGRPPRHTRFQPGQSGNPRGRPKGRMNLASAVRKALDERIEITINGRIRSLTKLDVTLTQLVNKAIKGDPRATQQILALAPLAEVEPPATRKRLDADERAVLADVLRELTDGAG